MKPERVLVVDAEIVEPARPVERSLRDDVRDLVVAFDRVIVRVEKYATGAELRPFLKR